MRAAKMPVALSGFIGDRRAAGFTHALVLRRD